MSRAWGSTFFKRLPPLAGIAPRRRRLLPHVPTLCREEGMGNHQALRPHRGRTHARRDRTDTDLNGRLRRSWSHEPLLPVARERCSLVCEAHFSGPNMRRSEQGRCEARQQPGEARHSGWVSFSRRGERKRSEGNGTYQPGWTGSNGRYMPWKENCPENDVTF